MKYKYGRFVHGVFTFIAGAEGLVHVVDTPSILSIVPCVIRTPSHKEKGELSVHGEFRTQLLDAIKT